MTLFCSTSVVARQSFASPHTPRARLARRQLAARGTSTPAPCPESPHARSKWTWRLIPRPHSRLRTRTALLPRSARAQAPSARSSTQNAAVDTYIQRAIRGPRLIDSQAHGARPDCLGARAGLCVWLPCTGLWIGVGRRGVRCLRAQGVTGDGRHDGRHDALARTQPGAEVGEGTAGAVRERGELQ